MLHSEGLLWAPAAAQNHQMSLMRLLKLVKSCIKFKHYFTKMEKQIFRNHDDIFYPKSEFHLAKPPLFSDVLQYLSCHISHSTFDFSILLLNFLCQVKKRSPMCLTDPVLELSGRQSIFEC